MSRRIYWLLPDLPSARATMNDLLVTGIPVKDIHFVAREDQDMHGLHVANVLQTSDVVRAAASSRCTTRSRAPSRNGASPRCCR
jgi:hypothetical protein